MCTKTRVVHLCKCGLQASYEPVVEKPCALREIRKCMPTVEHIEKPSSEECATCKTKREKEKKK
ncbi:hypothetical protein FVER14953_21331 [Fusarium verticillioides]|nr:hypothetical protein FVER14953_21331 [Fusarium verticillioides]